MADGFEMVFKFIFLSNLIKPGSKNPDMGAWYRIYLVMQKSIRWRQTRLFSSILPISTYFRVKLVIDRLLFNQLYFRGMYYVLGPSFSVISFFPISEIFSKIFRFLLDSSIIKPDKEMGICTYFDIGKEELGQCKAVATDLEIERILNYKPNQTYVYVY